MRELYVEQGLSTIDIADQLECAKSTIIRWLDKHEISTRERHNTSHPWHDEQHLRELYFEEGLDQYEIADRLGCEQVTIAKWFKKHEIETEWESVSKLRDKEWLERQYHLNGLSQHQIADELGCSQMTVSRWCAKHGIETDEANFEKHGSHRFAGGYEVFSSREDQVAVHRLIMVAEKGFDAVCGKVVHHQNEVKWDNRTENLELKTRSDHTSHHRSK